MPDESVNCCVTSPPYWELRDYGVDGQIGLEETPNEWCDALVDVFTEVRRVLRRDGTLWLNIGDSYNGSGRGGQGELGLMRSRSIVDARPINSRAKCDGLKSKDMIGAPWMAAFALRANGWYLRRDIIWNKPNAMPESVMDRPTTAHEYLFLLSKSERYAYDGAAIREGYTGIEDAVTFRGGSYTNNAPSKRRKSGNKVRKRGTQLDDGLIDTRGHGFPWQEGDQGRNARSVWTIATRPFPEAHFATFPPELARRCILAGCPKGGTVLDPFGGAGTTGLVADRLQRDAILIELNPDYADMAKRRIASDAGIFAEVA